MKAMDVVEMFVKWERLESIRTEKGNPRTGVFTVEPLPRRHVAGTYRVHATNSTELGPSTAPTTNETGPEEAIIT